MSPRKTDNPKVGVLSARMAYAEIRAVLRALKRPSETPSSMVRRILLDAAGVESPDRV